MTREIGGYLELEQFTGLPYRNGGIELDSARSCLAYLIELRGIRVLWIPDYMCDAVKKTCAAYGVKTKVYRVGADLFPVKDFKVGKDEWFYLADYFGQLDDEVVEGAREVSGGRLIVDEVQGFFRNPWMGVDTLYTCRKFFGVADGAYLFTGDGRALRRNLPLDESRARMTHIFGRFERTGSDFYSDYQCSEESFDYGNPRRMSRITENLLRAIDYETIIMRRERNFRLLDGAFSAVNDLVLRTPKGPYMYPLLVRQADGMREMLAKRSIYIPTLWPNVLTECNRKSIAYQYAANILPLPVDQRYGDADMERLIEEVKKCLN